MEENYLTFSIVILSSFMINIQSHLLTPEQTQQLFGILRSSSHKKLHSAEISPVLMTILGYLWDGIYGYVSEMSVRQRMTTISPFIPIISCRRR